MKQNLLLPATLASCFLSSLAAAEPGPHAVINISQALLRAYKDNDVVAFRQLLAPSVRERYPTEVLHQVMARCRALTFEIDRISLPSWGNRHVGYFGVYGELATLEMLLEIDDDEKVVHWAITDNITSRDQSCVISHRP